MLGGVMKNLVIVESPTKTKTLKKYLGGDFEVVASSGHIKDLPKSDLGVAVEKDFAPQYDVSPKKKKVVANLKAVAKGVDYLYLATDPDREGEAIAQHVYEVLRSSAKSKKQKLAFDKKVRRVVFNEITKEAVNRAFENPREVDTHLVDAQKARRVLDRLVGYKLSPLLWKKIRYGLSAGRVQSVAVRLIVEREREREKFKSQKYWKILATSSSKSSPKEEFEAELQERAGKSIFVTEKLKLFAGSYRTERTTINTQAAAKKIIKSLQGEDFIVESVDKKKITRSPSPPFTTATLQRAAAGALGFSGKRTMRAAQRLYERGLITYHRTDSVRLAKKFLAGAHAYIRKNFSDKYLPEKTRYYRTKSKTAQEAHEAIRPTKVSTQHSALSTQLGRDEKRLYKLIWQRAVASQMASTVFDATTVGIKAGDCLFEAKGSVLVFDGFLKVYDSRRQDEILPPLKAGDNLNLVKLESSQHQTSPPPRYTEATLIKDLEKFGIGRPSTYAPTISTILSRKYVVKEDRALKPEDVGMVVNDLLVEHFPEIVDLKFTAEMEDDLDQIADGKKKWVPIIREFYEPFEKELRVKDKELKKEDFTTLEKTKEKCPECKKPLIVKLGKYGKFLSCSGFPKCKYGRPYEDKDKDGEPDKADKSQLKGKCLDCGGELQLKEGRFGKFIACSKYPKCKFTKNYLDKIGMKCPDCGKGEVIVKKSKRGKVFYGCSRYPKCKFASWRDPRKPSPQKQASKPK